MIKNHNDHIKYGEIQVLFLNFIEKDEIDIEPIRIRFYTLRYIQGYTYALKKVKLMIRSIDDFLTDVLPRDLQCGLYYEFLVALRAHLLQVPGHAFPEYTLRYALHKKSKARQDCLFGRLPGEIHTHILKFTMDT